MPQLTGKSWRCGMLRLSRSMLRELLAKGKFCPHQNLPFVQRTHKNKRLQGAENSLSLRLIQ